MKQNLLRNCFGIKRILAVSFNHTCTYRYIVLYVSSNYDNFYNYVHLIYPDEIEIKDTTESDKLASLVDILLNIESNGRLTTTLYGKRYGFNVEIVNLTFLYSNILPNFD
jgi:hypothetical protein